MTEIFFEEYECKSLLRINGKDIVVDIFKLLVKMDLSVIFKAVIAQSL
jgi:hypothetical protein